MNDQEAARAAIQRQRDLQSRYGRTWPDTPTAKRVAHRVPNIQNIVSARTAVRTYLCRLAIPGSWPNESTSEEQKRIWQTAIVPQHLQVLSAPTIAGTSTQRPQTLSDLLELSRQDAMQSLHDRPLSNNAWNALVKDETGRALRSICTVCQEQDPIENTSIVVLPCGDEFHETCIRGWLGRQSVCPNCRHQLEDSTGE